MKFPIRIIGIAFILIGCTEISYKEPQPKGIKTLSKIPSKLHGTYQITENGNATDNLLIVFEKGYRFEPKDTTEKKEEYLLSDSIVLKSYKGYYFVSYRDNYEWNLRVVQRQKNGDLILMEMGNIPSSDPDRKEFLDQLSVEVPVIESNVNGSTHYIIDPAPKKLVELVKKGFFKEKTPLIKEKQ